MSAALVTGAARRLGKAMALSLAQRGLDVAIHYSGSADAAEETAELARQHGVSATTVQADLLDDDAVARLVPQACEALGKPLSVLINNASIFEPDEMQTVTLESWDRHIGSNLKAPLFLTQAFAAQAPRATPDDNGELLANAMVVNMIDQRVRKLTPHFMTYTLAKMGLWALTRTAAQGLAPDVRVNGIGPGPTMIGERQSETHFSDQRKATVLERGSDPDEIIRALTFILESPSLTGQLLCMDGGQHLGWKTPDVLGVE